MAQTRLRKKIKDGEIRACTTKFLHSLLRFCHQIYVCHEILYQIVQRTDVDESGEVGTGFAEKDGFEISSEKKFRLGSKDMSTTLFCSQYIIWLTNVHQSSNPFHHLQFEFRFELLLSF